MELKNESLSIKSYQLKWLLKVFTSLGLVFFCFTTLQRFLTLMNRKKRLFNGKTSINKQPCMYTGCWIIFKCYKATKFFIESN